LFPFVTSFRFYPPSRFRLRQGYGGQVARYVARTAHEEPSSRRSAALHDGTGGLIAGGLLFFALGAILAKVGQKKLD
jgi:hypothetical protein